MIHRLRAFTLIEMLVVIAIIALLMGLIGFSTAREQRGSKVRGAAEELASVLRRTRHRAVTEQRMYAVAFNIQNEPGSSGAVLNNRSGGHWYRVIGPSVAIRTRDQAPDAIPWGRGNRWDPTTGGWAKTNFPDFVQDVERCWVGPAHVLPARQVRFLALGDTDEGPRKRTSNGQSETWYASGGETTYPRPWFGYFDAASGRLWPWGGYDPTKPTSGFYYQGSDPVVVGCRNPVSRTVKHDWNGDAAWTDQDRNNDGDLDDPGERETAFPLQVQNEPRPLVNADWLDAVILFHANGTAEFGEWNRGRRSYSSTPDPTANSNDNDFLSGVADRCKVINSAMYTPLTNMDNGICPYEIGEVAHFTAHTGGWHITLAPDSLDDRTTFPTADAAIASISPCWRVFISASGTVSTFPVMERNGYIKSLQSANKAWPSNPALWMDTNATPTSNQIWLNCRRGFLHVTPNPTWNSSLPLVPRGKPITNILDPDMLTQRIWWRLP